MKRLSRTGRCLHYEAGERCNHIVDAHSIQQSGQLTKISESGHVVRLSADLSILRKTGGLLSGERIGIKLASTFAGFCQHHDNELFEPIDNALLVPTDLQVFLYAYRCVCREFFVKENASELLAKFRAHTDNTEEERALLKDMSDGMTLGFENLKHHKRQYDICLAQRAFNDIYYVCFISEDVCNVQLSGVLYPWFDFHGNELQDSGNRNQIPQLLTAFTAPTPGGWAYVFAWHISSDGVCSRLMASIADWISDGYSLPDALLRFTFSNFENHAMRPSWWKALQEQGREAIINRATLMVVPDISVPPNYLTYGLEGIADWRFKDVVFKQNKFANRKAGSTSANT